MARRPGSKPKEPTPGEAPALPPQNADAPPPGNPAAGETALPPKD